MFYIMYILYQSWPLFWIYMRLVHGQWPVSKTYQCTKVHYDETYPNYPLPKKWMYSVLTKSVGESVSTYIIHHLR
jgi:hypothetical protein